MSSRLEKTSKNIAFSFLNSFLTSILGIVSRTVFISCLGSEYLGLSGLLNNVLGILSISELGISTAIGFSLYKPLAQKNNKEVSALMSLYRKAYLIIALIVSVSGCILFPFLDFFVPASQQPEGTTFAFFAFLFNLVAGYLFSYKTTLINSDNQSYKLVPIYSGMSILQTFFQILVLVRYKNYILYLVVQILFSLITMIAQNAYITRSYSEIDFYSKEKLSDGQKAEIKKNVGGLVIAKIGDYLVNSTDNLIITKIVNLVATGIYSNYLLIRNIVNGYIGTVFFGLVAALGNIVVTETDQKKVEIFNGMMFCAFFIYSFEAVCLICLYNSFIGDLWLGKEFLFDNITVAIIVLNNYLTGLRIPLITMKSAAGKYMEDAWVPFAFAIINLVASIILSRWIGVAGVFLGTIVGSLLTADWYRPIVIYRTVFHISVFEYYKKYLVYVVLGILYMFAGWWICSFINMPSPLLSFVLKCIVAVTLPITCNMIIFYRVPETDLIKSYIKRILNRVGFSKEGN